MILKNFTKFKNFRIIAPVVLFFTLLIIYIFLFSPGILNKAALALQGDYTGKADGSAISATEWNYLDEDFLWKEGDTMGGNLNMGGHNITNLATPAATDVNYAATVGYVNSMGDASAKDRDGAPLRVVCDSTQPGDGWTNAGSGLIYIDVSTAGTAGANFSYTPHYFTSIGGSSSMWDQYGGSIALATAAGFRLYVKMFVGDSTVPKTTGAWYVNWCGVGN